MLYCDPHFTCIDSSDDSGLLAYVVLSTIHVFLVMFSRYDYHMIATLILYAWDCCGMRQGYICEGFLVWIIPSTY